MSAISGHDSGNGGGSDQIGVGGQRVSGNDIANSTSGVPYHNVVGLQADRQVWSLNQFHTVFLISLRILFILLSFWKVQKKKI